MVIRNFRAQLSNALRSLASAAFILMALLMAAPVSAQTQQQMNWCDGQDGATPQQRIDGCTAAIKSGNYAGEDLAILFNNRGAAYADKNLYNLADNDYEQALTLKPDFTAALQNRKNVYVSKKQYLEGKLIAPSKPRIEIDQKKFLSLLSGYRVEYERGINELQRAAARTTARISRDRTLCTFPDPYFAGWLGKIDLSEVAYLGVTVTFGGGGSNISVEMHSQQITPSSPLYQTIYDMKDGAYVIFSGSFVRRKDGCIHEQSITETGSMRKPEFAFVLTEIAVAPPIVR